MRAGLTVLLLLAGTASADTVLRIAAVAPEGTAWAREARAFAREVQESSHGAVRIKLYLGGITGDERESEARARRGQLDGIASGSALCMQLAPSSRVMQVMGLFQTRDESAKVAARLRPLFDEELRRAGYVNLGSFAMGPALPFTSRPLMTLHDLQQTRFWTWNDDPIYPLELPLLGMTTVSTSLADAGPAFEHGQVDGFIAIPTAALAFQWSTQARYVSDLKIGFLRGCFLVSSRAFDQLSVEARETLRSASAKLTARLDELGRAQDEQLLGGLFQRQGLKLVPASVSLRAQFLELARQARERLGDKLVPPELLQRVLAMLADLRVAEPIPK